MFIYATFQLIYNRQNIWSAMFYNTNLCLCGRYLLSEDTLSPSKIVLACKSLRPNSKYLFMLWHTLLVFTRNFHLNKYSYHSILVFAQILQDTQNHLSFVFGIWKKDLVSNFKHVIKFNRTEKLK